MKDFEKYVDRMLLSEYAPAGVVVDADLCVLQVRGDTSAYLQLPSGEPTRDLTKLLKAGLLAPVNAVVAKVRKQGRPASETGIRIRSENQIRSVDLRAMPVPNPVTQESCFLVLFEESRARERQPQTEAGENTASAAPISDGEEILRLEQELKATRDYLQSIIESQDAVAEELRSANEEAQATNDELDTAKADLQASNEELYVVNDELRKRNFELSTLNSDLRKLLDSINVPLVMVGKNLEVRWFTPAMEPLLNLRPTDQGRPITDLQSGTVPNFRELLAAALAGEQSLGVEIESATGRWLSLRIVPYRGPDDTIDGAIATLIDIDDLKQARDFAQGVVAVVREPLIALDAGLRVKTANQAFYRMFKLTSENTEGRLIYDIADGVWNIPKLKHLLEDFLPRHSFIQNFELAQAHQDRGIRTMLLHASEIRQGAERMILLAIDDVTELRQSAEGLRKTNEDLKQFIYAASHDLQEPIRTIVTYNDLLARRYSGLLGAEGSLFVNYAVEGALRLEHLIAGLREFWELSERVEQDRIPVDCNQVLKTVLLTLERTAGENAAVITVDPLPQVMAAEPPLIQLFQNLIGNALKYRSDQPPRIHISAVDLRLEWLFSIEDNGLGIDPKYAREIFRVFKRLHPRSKYPGTGMGLAICEKIVERYGGRIWVEPRSGHGSIFKFTIPSLGPALT